MCYMKANPTWVRKEMPPMSCNLHTSLKYVQVRIPDDRSSRSQFAIIDDDLEQQLRDILEANITEHDSSVFVMAKAQYKARCSGVP